MSLETKYCDWYGCRKSENLVSVGENMVCEFHKNGGIFNTGDLFEQYVIIEEDFINIIKYIPLERENFKLVSPRFSDILIRCGVATEIFFREWLNHFEFSNRSDILKLREKKRLNINDFYKVFIDRIKNSQVYVRQLDEDIFPFVEWEEHVVPDWWDSYNNIKHHKADKQKNATLESALNALAALFLLHCKQADTFRYLCKYSNTNLITGMYIILNSIKTPLESKRFLFLYQIRKKSSSQSRI